MRSGKTWLALLAVLALAARCFAQVEVAASQGEVARLRAGQWAKVSIGDRLQVGERVRTTSAERVKLLILDRAVVDLAPNSEIVVDESEARPDGRLAVAMRLLRGRLLAAIGSGFEAPGSYFSVETGAGVVTSRGGELLVQYEAADGTTEVASLAGEAEVVSNVAALGGGKVRVPAGSLVRIARGRLPGAASAVGIERVRQLAQGVEIFGTGRRDGLNVLHPLLAGKLLSAQDVPGGPGAGEGPERRLGGSVPGPALGAVLSADVYTNTQPIEVFRASPPGRPPGGNVVVEF